MHNKVRKKISPILLVLALISLAVLALGFFFGRYSRPGPTDSPQDQLIVSYAKENNLSFYDYPRSLIDLLGRNPETETFVLEYPFAKDRVYDIDLTTYSRDTVPLLLQWDQRWGYIQYGSDVAGLTGCGPVCLSMVGYYLTGSNDFAPDKILAFAADNGYYVKGSGTSWTLFSEGAGKLGLKATELPLDEGRIQANLEAGIPIVCSVRAGDFTTSGHYIVLAGWEDGKIRVNDPNSMANSETLWTYEQLEGQIRNLWAIEI